MPDDRLRRAIAILSQVQAVPTVADAPAIQAARLELDKLLADLWRSCPVWAGAGYRPRVVEVPVIDWQI